MPGATDFFEGIEKVLFKGFEEAVMGVSVRRGWLNRKRSGTVLGLSEKAPGT